MILDDDLILENSSIRYYGTTSTGGGSVTLQYDANGNLIQDSQFHFEYNNANQLSRVRQGSSTGTILEEYIYDINGQRAIKHTYSSVNTSTYYASSLYEVVNYTNGTGETSKYYFANGERIAEKANGEVLYYHSDHNLGQQQFQQ